jgi:hypothetical protein
MTVRSHSQVSALVIGVIIGLVAGVLLTVVAFRLLPSPQMVSQPEPLLEAPSGQAYASRVAVSAAGGGLLRQRSESSTWLSHRHTDRGDWHYGDVAQQGHGNPYGDQRGWLV